MAHGTPPLRRGSRPTRASDSKVPSGRLRPMPMLVLAIAAAASVAPRPVLDPLSLLGDKAAQKTVLRSYTPLPGMEMATLAMS